MTGVQTCALPISATEPSDIEEHVRRVIASGPRAPVVDSCSDNPKPLALYATRSDPGPADCCISPRDMDAMLSRSSVACLMSRQGKYPDGRRQSVRCLVDAITAALNAGETLVASNGTLAFDIARRLCRGRPHDYVALSSDAFRSELDSMISTRARPAYPIAVALAKTNSERLAARDDWIIALADRFICVAIRKRSGWLNRLSRISRDRISVYSPDVVSDSETDARGNADLLETGASIIERIVETNNGLKESSAKDETLSHQRTELPFGGSYLLHHTSGSSEAWPNETNEERLDRIMSGGEPSRCDGIGALLNIIKTKTLVATGGGLLPGERAVCFTTLKLSESRGQYRYDRARSRHIFSPCAVGIRRDSLLPRIKPVLYGDRSVRELIPAADRFRFQLMDERDSAGKDYRNEYEWRSSADVNLDEFNAADIFIVAETDRDAMRIRSRSRWRVVSASDLMNAETGRNA